MSTSLINTEPASGLSRPPMALNSVDLPEPEGPMIDRYSPRRMSRSTPFSARTTSSPIRNSFTSPLVRTTYSFDAIFGSTFPGILARPLLSARPLERTGLEAQVLDFGTQRIGGRHLCRTHRWRYSRNQRDHRADQQRLTALHHTLLQHRGREDLDSI